MRVLTVNPGSTSLKVALVEDGQATASDSVGEHAALPELAARWEPVDAVGVRFVHGGAAHLQPVVLDEQVLAELDEVADLAPLHNPAAASAGRALLSGHAPVVACFDTTFHAGLPAEAATYALPREWNSRWSLRRYGFHGLSHEHAATRARELVPGAAAELRVVSCHLGGGASLCASVGGRSVDTTMGFTPLEGLVMQTRSGSVDPGLLLWLLRQEGIDAAGLEQTLDQRAGLAGLSGTSGDMREVLRRADEGDPDGRLALGVYVHRLRRETGAMVASAGGLDALVFTGGVGEHAAAVRRRVCEGLAHLGVDLAPDDTTDRDGDREISSDGSAVRVLVVAAREELVMAEHVARVVRADGRSTPSD